MMNLQIVFFFWSLKYDLPSRSFPDPVKIAQHHSPLCWYQMSTRRIFLLSPSASNHLLSRSELLDRSEPDSKAASISSALSGNSSFAVSASSHLPTPIKRASEKSKRN